MLRVYTPPRPPLDSLPASVAGVPSMLCELAVYASPAVAPGERRTAERTPGSLTGCCYPLPAGPRARRLAVLRDVSAGGLGLLCDCSYEPDTLLVVHLPAVVAGGLRLLTVRVAHATSCDGGWLVGCAFHHPPSAADVEALAAVLRGAGRGGAQVRELVA